MNSVHSLVMLSIWDLMRWLAVLSAFLDIMLIVRLSADGFAGVYHWFTRFLIFDVLATALLVSAMHTRPYMAIQICTRPLYWVLLFGVLLEIYSLLLSQRPRLCGLLRGAVIVGAAVSVAAMLAQSPHLCHPATVSQWCLTFAAVHRTITYVLAVASVLPWLFVARFRTNVSPAVLTHALLFAVLIGVDAGYWLARLMGIGIWTAALARLLLWNFFLAGRMVGTATATRSLPARACA